jgi:hypothetical protein
MGTRESQGSFLAYFEKSCSITKETKSYKVWQTRYHAEIDTNWFIKQVDYIHNNPVDKVVTSYYFSSARNYSGLK